jgi:hypothetical protein
MLLLADSAGTAQFVIPDLDLFLSNKENYEHY